MRHLEAFGAEQASDGLAHERLVVHQENDGRWRVHVLAEVSAGSVKWKTAPPPEWFSADNSPPWAKRIERHTARPRPSPCGLVVKNGSKMRSSASRGIPRPWSRTETRTPSLAIRSVLYVETAVVASGHCIARVHHEIEQHLLKLHSVAEDWRQDRREVRLDGDALIQQIAARRA